MTKIVGVFGLPGTGKTTIVKALINASREIMTYISSGDIARDISSQHEKDYMAKGNLFPYEEVIRGEILKLINKRKGQGADYIFLDGFPRTAEQIRWLLDNQLAGTFEDGCFLHVRGGDLERRILSRARDDQDSVIALRKKIDNQQVLIDTMDKHIVEYGLPYFTIINTDLERSVIQLAQILKLRK